MPDEVPNNLRSRQHAKIIDLLSEGPIRGVVNGMKGVYLDGTALQSSTGALAYKNLKVQFLNGYPAQPIMTGFSGQETEESVGLRLKYNAPLTRTILSPDCDRARVTVSVPSLSFTNTETGDMWGARVSYWIYVKPSTKSTFQAIGYYAIEGKTTSRYQRAHTFALPGIGPWELKVQRHSVNSTEVNHQNDLYWDSFTSIIDDRVNFTRSACVGIQVDAEQFSTLPKRTYLTDGLLMNIPKNYNPYTATYTGTWDGTFKIDWCNNPAWVFYDLIVNNRYGLGSFISSSMIDKWALYKVAQWCDGRVPNGHGGTERRFTCNVQIMEQSEAFDLLSQIASIFRGFAYWAGGQLVAIADDPSDPVMQYSHANVIDGNFTYSGADRRARHTMAMTGWSDKTLLGERRLAVAENPEQLSRWGIQSIEDPGFGSSSESQSLRTGKWALYTEQYESESVTFSTGLDSAWVRPGDIIRIADPNIAGKRTGGRIVGVNPDSDQHIIVDQRPPMVDGNMYYLSCIIPWLSDPNQVSVVTKTAYLSANPNQIFISEPFVNPPVPDSVFVLNDPGDLEPTLWRVISTKQTDIDHYEIQALRHFPQKWNYIEKGIAFAEPDISDIAKKPAAVRNLAVKEYMVQTSPISVGVRVAISWQSSATSFDVYWRRPPGNWAHVRVDGQAYDLAVQEGVHEFRVVPIGPLGVRGDAQTLSVDIIGRFALPAAPKNFRINVVDALASFDWLPATELDVIIGGYFQLRHTATLSGANWNAAQVVIPKVPGSATSCETGYQPGTWFLRTFDITGRGSATWAAIVGTQQDTRYLQWDRKCESPDFLGDKDNTELRLPQNWLTIQGVNSGQVDQQLNNISTWTEIDNLPVPEGTVPGPNVGTYTFDQYFDAGAPFSVRFSSDILAFPFADPAGDWIDDRFTFADTWPNWDDLSADFSGQVTLQIRTTLDDPLSVDAEWSEWKPFLSGEQYGRGFQFQAVLSAPPGENIGVETLCIIGDFKSKYDEGNDIVYAAADKYVPFRIKFFNVPAVVLTVQNAAASDQIQIIAKTKDGFTVRINNPPGTQVNRTFDWHAQGY